MYLRQSTASQEILLGRFVDSTDGDTEETGLTINNTDIKLFKSGATTLANKNSGGGTHIANGMYYAVLDATDTDTIGNLEVHVHVAGALSVMRTYTVLDEAVYDVLFGTTALATVSNITGGTITTTTNLTNLPSIPANWLTAAGIAASALNGKGDWNIGKTGYALSSAGVQAIWDALTSALTTVGSIGKRISDNLDAAITSRMASYTQPTGFLAATFPSTVASPTNITAGTITTTTNLTNLPSIPANWLTAAGIAASALNGKGDWNIGKTGYALSAAGVQAIWDALTSALTTVGSIGKLLVDNINATISSRLASASYTAPLDAAGTRAAVGLGSANLDTQLGDLPTNAELATALGTADDAVLAAIGDLPTNAELATALAAADDAVLAAIAALNNLSAADVNAQVVDALSTDTYAEPTGAPAATASLATKINYLYMMLRNKLTVTNSAKTFYSDGGVAQYSKALSDDGTTYTEDEAV